VSTSILLAPRGKVPFIGPEVGRRLRTGIARFVGEPVRGLHGVFAGGSVRYVKYAGGHPVGALQIIDQGSGRALAANVFVAPEQRRMGVATELWARARRDYPALRQADPVNRTDLGDAWVLGMEKKRQNF